MAEKRKKAEAAVGQRLLGPLTDCDLSRLSTAKLIREIKMLRQELEQEKAKNRLKDGN